MNETTLENYLNGNISLLDRIELIQLIRYFENKNNENIEY